MLFPTLLIINTLLFAVYAYLGYTDTFKQSSWFFVSCIALVIAGNALWIYFIKITKDPNTIYISGLIWDASIAIAFLAIPVIFFNVKLSKVSLLGLIMCICGMILLKGGDLITTKLNNKTSKIEAAK